MVDVTVRGAGIFGLCAAWFCLRRGASVRVIDPGGVGAGASGGLVGALAPHVPENWNDKKAFQLDSLLMAEGFWADVEATGGVAPGYGRTGRLQPLGDDRAVEMARARALGAKELWQGRAIWRVVAVEDLGPWAPPSATGYLIHDTLSARLHPRRTATALAAALRVQGVEIVSHAENEGRVLWATGAQGLADLSADRPRPVGGAVKGQAALLRYDAGPHAPQIFVDGLHLVGHADGTLAVGSTSEREFDDPRSTDAQLDEVLERAVQAMPVLHGAEVIERWAGLRPRARSRAPMLGAWPGRPGHFVANGGFKIGFGVAPKVGAVMADLMLDGRDEIPDGFRVEASM